VFTAEYCMDPRWRLRLPELRRRGLRRGGRRPHDQDHLQRAQALPLRPLRRRPVADPQKAQFENCMGARAAECTDANFYADRHRPLRRDRLQGQRRGARGEPELPRRGQARLRHRGAQGRRRRGLGRAPVLETGEFDYAGTSRSSPRSSPQMAAAGRGEVMARGRHARRAHPRSTRRPRSGARRHALDRRASAPVPDRRERGQGDVASRSTARSSPSRLRRRGAGDLQPRAAPEI
jgi:hypothetical protein